MYSTEGSESAQRRGRGKKEKNAGVVTYRGRRRGCGLGLRCGVGRNSAKPAFPMISFREKRGILRRGKRRRTYPRTVRQMLTKRSAPQPAIMKTPTGGTVLFCFAVSFCAFWEQAFAMWEKLFEPGRTLREKRVSRRKAKGGQSKG